MSRNLNAERAKMSGTPAGALPLPEAIRRYNRLRHLADRVRPELERLTAQIRDWGLAHGKPERTGKRIRAARKIGGARCVVIITMGEIWSCDPARLLRQCQLATCLKAGALAVVNAKARDLVPLEFIGANEPRPRLVSCEAMAGNRPSVPTGGRTR